MWNLKFKSSINHDKQIFSKNSKKGKIVEKYIFVLIIPRKSNSSSYFVSKL